MIKELRCVKCDYKISYDSESIGQIVPTCKHPASVCVGEVIMTGFETKDSGERQEFRTGMKRDTQKNKARYDLIWQPGLKRLAELMARGAEKYSERNWEKASTQEELNRFKSSAYRHFMQWFNNETDEDHMAATIFNLFGAEFVKEKLTIKEKL